jgi:hypothetical protein
MTWGAVAAAGSTLIGAYGASKAADAQEESARLAAAEQRRQFNKQVELQKPFRDVGVNALPDLVAASKYTPFTMEQFRASPSYGFRLQEGIKALDRSAAARGGLLSGNQLRGVSEFGQKLASDEYTNAFNQYQIERNARLNPLQSLVGMGQTSTNTLTGAAGQLGSNLSDLAVGAGNARASGYAGVANAFSSGIGQGYNYYQGNQAAKQQQQNFNTYMNYLNTPKG